MLLVRDLTIRYPGWVGRYDLAVPRGAVVALVGPSGGGKSTLLNAVAGFERVASGELAFEGADLLPLRPAERPVAIVFQEHNLLPTLQRRRQCRPGAVAGAAAEAGGPCRHRRGAGGASASPGSASAARPSSPAASASASRSPAPS